MALAILIKVYNKDGKLKLQAHDTDTLKIVSIHKYDEEIEEIHSFTCWKSTLDQKRFIKNGDKYEETELILHHNEQTRRDRTTYYDYVKKLGNSMIERFWFTNLQIEHWEVVGNMEEVKTTKIIETGNVYEERKKQIGKEVYKTEFKNGEMTNFHFTIPENKIKGYLERL